MNKSLSYLLCVSKFGYANPIHYPMLPKLSQEFKGKETMNQRKSLRRKIAAGYKIK